MIDNGGITVFISYAEEDADAARRLYNDLIVAGLNPWIDKEKILPGQNLEFEIRKAIKNGGYFLSLNSSRSVQKIGVVQIELKEALEVQKNFPESAVYLIPVRIDNCQLGYQKLEEIQHVDMFPDWKRGLEKIMQTMEVENQRDSKIVDKVKNQLESSVVKIESVLIPPGKSKQITSLKLLRISKVSKFMSSFFITLSRFRDSYCFQTRY
jgi:TIR domain